MLLNTVFFFSNTFQAIILAYLAKQNESNEPQQTDRAIATMLGCLGKIQFKTSLSVALIVIERNCHKLADNTIF